MGGFQTHPHAELLSKLDLVGFSSPREGLLERRPIEAAYDQGTIVVRGLEGRAPGFLAWDDRIGAWRGAAGRYEDLKIWLAESGYPPPPPLGRYGSLALQWRYEVELRGYQSEAVRAWEEAGRRGSIVLPTGAGKTVAALSCIARAGTDALVVAPTIDLVGQWYDQIKRAFGASVGILGGGCHEIGRLTVSTYESAYIHADALGERFGLLVFDEVHHLPSPKHLQIPEMCLAPWRLGLTATYERDDDAHRLLDEPVGPVVYRKEIGELKGEYLADYDLVRIKVPLAPEERGAYDAARADFLDFVRREKFTLFGKGWDEFIRRSARDGAARKALLSYRRARDIALRSEGKLGVLEGILRRHHGERTILFTESNEAVYRISRTFLVPAITHRTHVKERREILRRFREGSYRTVATSKVLNEGVDVPDASVAVVVSGSASKREQVQRLGRVLRPRRGKRAVLYELVTSSTTEGGQARRRRVTNDE